MADEEKGGMSQEKQTGIFEVGDTPALHQEAPAMTKQQLLDQLDALTAKAKEAGIRPIQVMAESYLTRFVTVLDGLLGALDEGASKDKKK